MSIVDIKVTDVSPFNDNYKIVTSEFTVESGMWWWFKRRIETHRHLTSYGYVWNCYPEGARSVWEHELMRALCAWNAREAANEEMGL